MLLILLAYFPKHQTFCKRVGSIALGNLFRRKCLKFGIKDWFKAKNWMLISVSQTPPAWFAMWKCMTWWKKYYSYINSALAHFRTGITSGKEFYLKYQHICLILCQQQLWWFNWGVGGAVIRVYINWSGKSGNVKRGQLFVQGLQRLQITAGMSGARATPGGGPRHDWLKESLLV